MSVTTADVHSEQAAARGREAAGTGTYNYDSLGSFF